jgi:hypothetical protein
MKHIFVFIIIFISTFSLKGQTVVIECQGGAGATDCFLTDPAPFNTPYVANINDGNRTSGNGWSRQTPIWDATGGIDNTLNSGVQTNAQWTNSPNTPQKKIKVSVTYKKTGQNDTTVTNEKNVTVKHIGAIASMTFSGSISSSVSGSGLTVGLPCTTNSLTITIPTPVTDPAQSLIYSWAVSPSSWTGSSSSNTITITPLIGGDGTVTINAKRTDGTVVRSFSVNFSRSAFEVTKPIITDYFSPGTELEAVCVNYIKFYRSQSTNATTYKWTVSPSGALLFPNGDTFENVLVSVPSERRKAVLTLTASNNCGAATIKSTSTDVFIGKPEIVTATVNGGSQSYPNYIQNPCLLNIGAESGGETGLTYDWQVLSASGSGAIYYNGYNQVSAYAYPFAQIQGKISNQCGNNTTTFYIQNGSPYYRMASTNPTQSTISVEIDREVAKLTLVSVKLVSHGRNAIERSFTAEDAQRTNHFDRSNKIDFDVANLPRGTYYLLIDFKNYKTIQETIVLN